MMPEIVEKTLNSWAEEDLIFKKIENGESMTSPFPTIYYLNEYYPADDVQWLSNEDTRRKNHNRILRLKEKSFTDLLYYAKNVENIFEKINFDCQICVIPSHNVGVRSEHIWNMFNLFHVKQGISLDDCLYRIVNNGKKSRQKNIMRSAELDYQSLMVKSIIPNADYVILDDVTTSGASMMAATRLLYEAGARLVYCLALSKTMHVVDN